MEPLLQSHERLIAMNERTLQINEQLLQKIDEYRREIERLRAEANNPEQIESAVNRIIYAAFHASFEHPPAHETSVCANDMERRISRRLSTKLRAVKLRLWLTNAKQCDKK